MTSQDPTPTVVTEQTERQLVARLKAGDPDAYEELVRTLGGRLLAVARRMLRDEEAARDAVQDAMLSAFRAIQTFDEQAQLSTWLHRIVVNAALMKLRTRQRKPEQSIEPMLPRFAEDGHHAEAMVSWAESAERRLERAEMQVILRAAIDELPESYRAVIMMRDIDGMSTADAAAAMGVSENALKLRLHRARQALGTIVRERLNVRQATRPVPRAAQTAATARAAARRTDRFRGSAMLLAV